MHLQQELSMSDNEFRLLRNLVYEESGIWLKDEKKLFLQHRAFQRMKKLKIKSPYRYYKLLNDEASAKEELLSFLDALTINETSFFRNRPQLELFASLVVSDIVERKRKAGDFTIKIWSAGCSTGQEPYTISMILNESIADIKNWKVTILASDLSLTALQASQRGVYPKDKLHGVDAAHIARYFKVTSESYEVVDAVKRLVVFDFHNLMHEHGVREFDAIFCRNVFIYFDEPTQDKIIDRFHRALAPKGYLLLGHTESLQGRSENFTYIHKNRGTVYQKK